MTEIRETKLPGVGVLHDFKARSGDRVGLISHHTGRREMVFYDRADPDCVRDTAVLTEAEAVVLADMLGGTSVVERLEGLRTEITGLAIDWIPVSPTSRFAGHSIEETQIRARTGASIVAIIRGTDTIPAPSPEDHLLADDVVLAVGTADGLNAAAEILMADDS
jgi:TrkA domain protein